MLLVRQPDIQEKMALLTSSARFELCGAEEGCSRGSTGGEGRLSEDVERHRLEAGTQSGSILGEGRLSEDVARYLFRPAARTSAPLLKVLLTDACRNDCLYCAFRAGARRPRTTFQPEELAGAFLEMYRRGRASGIFLSSGLGGDSRGTMEKMLQTVELLRRRHRFPGYVHLKILPGATDDYVEAACRLADRVSTNLEAPNPTRLAAIAPGKLLHEELMAPLERVAALRRQGPILPFGHTTQFVVGAAGEADREILQTTAQLYAQAKLTRAYFSAFNPLPGTPLEDCQPTPAARQRRLYQADTLLRSYGFSLEEIPLDGRGNLNQGRDPKLEWALRHPERFPLEVNRASRGELLRVPGIGPRGVDALVRARRSGRLTGLEGLRGFPLLLSRAAPFLLVNGRRPALEQPVQGELWPSAGAESAPSPGRDSG